MVRRAEGPPVAQGTACQIACDGTDHRKIQKLA